MVGEVVGADARVADHRFAHAVDVALLVDHTDGVGDRGFIRNR